MIGSSVVLSLGALNGGIRVGVCGKLIGRGGGATADT